MAAIEDDPMAGAPLTHFNDQGRARMVDVTDKAKTHRVARAAGKVRMNPSTIALVREGRTRKGDVLAVAQVAGIMAAKRCWELVPMCHPLQLTGVDVHFSLEPDGVAVEAVTKCVGETGVEMEALTAVSVATLTVYDMCKAHQRDMVIDRVRLLEKEGGKSGHFLRQAAEPTVHGSVGSHAGKSTDLPVAMQPAGTVAAVCLSERKGERKHPVESIELVVGSGIAGDAHAGSWHRQVSLLADESVDLMRASGWPDLGPGDFAENILTRGISVHELPVGTVLAVGPALLVVTQIGKTCHNDCEIRRKTGMCVMPTKGIFCVVVRGGRVRAGDAVRVLGQDELAAAGEFQGGE